jgi:hypothetical protein
MADTEIKTLQINYIFSNSIYDVIVCYQGMFIRRLNYYGEIDKAIFIKKRIFGEPEVEVLQIVKNEDV